MDRALKIPLKRLAVVVLVLFILWNVCITALAFVGCPPTYHPVQIKIPDGGAKDPIINVTGEDLQSHPGLEDLIRYNKDVLLPVGTVVDFVPGTFFGPRYSDRRISLQERRYLEDHYCTVWKYNGSYYRYAAFA
jgi:hypothetical protein